MYDIAVGARTEKKSKLSNTRRDVWREREGEDGRKRLGGAGWCWRWLLVVVGSGEERRSLTEFG